MLWETTNRNEFTCFLLLALREAKEYPSQPQTQQSLSTPALSVASIKTIPLSLGKEFRNAPASVKDNVLYFSGWNRNRSDHFTWIHPKENSIPLIAAFRKSLVAARPIWTLLYSTSSERQMYWILLSIGQQMILVAEPWFNIHPHHCVSHFPLCHLFLRLKCRPLSLPHPLHHHWLRGWFRSFWGCFYGQSWRRWKNSLQFFIFDTIAVGGNSEGTAGLGIACLEHLVTDFDWSSF